MRQAPVYGPRGLTCIAVLRKNRAFIDPGTKLTGRCGECRTCWRLFVYACKREGKPLPRVKRNGSIGRFTFVHRSVEK